MLENYIDIIYSRPEWLIYITGCLINILLIRDLNNNRKLDQEDYTWYSIFTACSWIFIVLYIFMGFEQND